MSNIEIKGSYLLHELILNGFIALKANSISLPFDYQFEGV